MTDKQKEAIVILNRLHELRGTNGDGSLTDDEYFTLMEFVLCENKQVQYYPWLVEQPSLRYPWITYQSDPNFENLKFTSDSYIKKE